MLAEDFVLRENDVVKEVDQHRSPRNAKDDVKNLLEFFVVHCLVPRRAAWGAPLRPSLELLSREFLDDGRHARDELVGFAARDIEGRHDADDVARGDREKHAVLEANR